jgi:sulfite oxidase
MSNSTPRVAFDADGLNTACRPDPAAHVTPVSDFFTRSHAPVPVIDPAGWHLDVSGLVARPLRLSLSELLDRFPVRDVAATLVCAGMRRAELLTLAPMPGELPWGLEPVSTGRWRGVALRDVLELAGVTDAARHVELIGLDQVERHGERFGFGGSIDLTKARSAEVLLATHLNQEPLAPAHGFPLRAVVPGWIGARSVKWLGRIVVSAEPSLNYFQTRAYRVQRQVDPTDPRDVSAGTSLAQCPLNAVILDPRAGQRVRQGSVRLRGWAMGAGGRELTAVAVSPDGGSSWVPARVTLAGEPWCWSLWEAELPLDAGTRTLAVRAADSGGLSQPATLQEAWNVKGYCNNAWHRVTIDVE